MGGYKQKKAKKPAAQNKKVVEQNDPFDNKAVTQKKHDILTGVYYVVSIYEHPVIVDAHMHIMSSRTAPLPYLWTLAPAHDLTAPVLRLLDLHSRENMESMMATGGGFAGLFIYEEVEVPGTGGLKERRQSGLTQLKTVGEKDTFKLGDDFVATRLLKTNEKMLQEPIYNSVPKLLYMAMSQSMDMEYAHLDGYFGLKVYNGVYISNRADSKPIKYWTTWHRRKREYSHERIDYYSPDRMTLEEFKGKKLDEDKYQYIPGVYWKGSQKNQINIKALPLAMPDSETKYYEPWDEQVYNTELAMLKYPLKLFPMYHFEPRRWQLEPHWKDEVFGKVSGSGLFLGFKIYTAQGYRPWDVDRLPIMKDFYFWCCTNQIPIMNHCTPQGAKTFDEREYYEFIHPNDPGGDTLYNRGEEVYNEEVSLNNADKYKKYLWRAEQETFDAAQKYFLNNFVSPKAWDKVLSREVEIIDKGQKKTAKLNKLRLCLAHFGGNIELGRKWTKQIIDLINKYPNVYTDLSYSFCKEDFREFFKEVIYKEPKFETRIRQRILFGTDWYMVVKEGYEYQKRCEEIKRFLDSFDTSLWIRFTQVNPHYFYGLHKPRIRQIAENIKAKLLDEKVRRFINKELDETEIKRIDAEVEYIMKANESHIKGRESRG